MLKRILKFLAWTFGILLLLLAGLLLYVRQVARTEPPVVVPTPLATAPIRQPDPGLYTLGKNWFRQSESGLYELYVEGTPYERGVANGRLTQTLVQYQEDVFTGQINKFVPNGFYLGMLKYMVGWFNRDLESFVPEEYQQEIYGVSQAASSAHDNIAPAYQRILNYHGAHDIGHALQNMSLVGCTAFATWGRQSADSTLIVGRNFDFYVGDEFARDKIVAFYAPEKGHKFMMLTFGGMTGVVSGMNDAGLTVTINAAKSDVPGAAATPVSLVAREILQYASTIAEAYSLAARRKMFVSESFLIGSARDNRAALIEKTPDAMDLYEPDREYIISTNHFLGEKLGRTELNEEHMRTSASPYRFSRVEELLVQKASGPNTVQRTAAILRDQRGLDNKTIGMGNEKLVNQLVAHHAVIFEPAQQRVWISTAPWQLGKFVCYDLKKVFAQRPTRNEELYEEALTIPADSFLLTQDYRDYVKFHRYRFPFAPRTDLDPDSVVRWNPLSYHAYMLAGDQCLERKQYEQAAHFYEKGLTLETATVQEREHMEKNLQRCKEKML
jgi:hypothetical protein